jgi:hypothetical protein
LREPNILLDALIDEAGMSHDGLAARVNQAGKRHSLVCCTTTRRSAGGYATPLFPADGCPT